MRWLLAKDLRILRRSPLLVALLVIYPIVVALLIGFALSRGPGKPRVAFADLIPASARTFNLGGQHVDTSQYARILFKSIKPIPVASREEAIAKVRSGAALGALIIPADITQRLASGFQSANVEVIYNGDALEQSYVQSTIASKLAQANQALAERLKSIAASEVDLLLKGGNLQLLGQTFNVLGLQAGKRIIDDVLARLPPHSPQRPELTRLDHFAALAVDNLGASKEVLSTVAEPIQVHQTLISGRRTPLNSFAVAIAVTVSLMFVAVLLAAGTLALEREENTFARLVRGLVSRGGLLASKAGLAAGCGFVVSLVMLCGIGAFVSLDWSRFGLWVLALICGAAAFATLGVAIGSVAREVRAASLLAFLFSLPIAFLALVPAGAVATGLYDVVRVISAVLPFKAALQAVDAAVNSSSPGIGVSIAHLAGVAAGFAVVARVALRRFG
jgi:ABC-type transport system involved in cytochrome c biogenesis permease component